MIYLSTNGLKMETQHKEVLVGLKLPGSPQLCLPVCLMTGEADKCGGCMGWICLAVHVMATYEVRNGCVCTRVSCHATLRVLARALSSKNSSFVMSARLSPFHAAVRA